MLLAWHAFLNVVFVLHVDIEKEIQQKGVYIRGVRDLERWGSTQGCAGFGAVGIYIRGVRDLERWGST